MYNQALLNVALDRVIHNDPCGLVIFMQLQEAYNADGNNLALNAYILNYLAAQKNLSLCASEFLQDALDIYLKLPTPRPINFLQLFYEVPGNLCGVIEQGTLKKIQSLAAKLIRESYPIPTTNAHVEAKLLLQLAVKAGSTNALLLMGLLHQESLAPDHQSQLVHDQIANNCYRTAALAGNVSANLFLNRLYKEKLATNTSMFTTTVPSVSTLTELALLQDVPLTNNRP